MKKEWKICKNPECRKKFYREERHTHHQWNRIRFHNRECQVELYNRNRRVRKTKNKFPNAMSLQALHDACNKYTTKARKEMRDKLVVYDSKDMTQEELENLIPSMGGGK